MKCIQWYLFTRQDPKDLELGQVSIHQLGKDGKEVEPVVNGHHRNGHIHSAVVVLQEKIEKEQPTERR